MKNFERPDDITILIVLMGMMTFILILFTATQDYDCICDCQPIVTECTWSKKLTTPEDSMTIQVVTCPKEEES